MANFYRQFTQNLAKRLNSRALDINPQFVEDNNVQMTVDVERPFFKQVSCQLRISDVMPVGTWNAWNYILPIAVLNDNSIGLSMYPALSIEPLVNLQRDNVVGVTVNQISYYVRVNNPSGVPTASNVAVQFQIIRDGTQQDLLNRQYLNESVGSIAAGAGREVTNRLKASFLDIGDVSLYADGYNVSLPVVANNRRDLQNNYLFLAARILNNSALNPEMNVVASITCKVTIEYGVPYQEILRVEPGTANVF